MWRDVAVNSSCELVVKAVLKSEIGNALLADEEYERPSPTFNFRRLAIALSHDAVDHISPIPEPLLRPDDLFFVLQLERVVPDDSRPDSGRKKSEVVAAYCVDDCSTWFDNREEVQVSLAHAKHASFVVARKNPMAPKGVHIGRIAKKMMMKDLHQTNHSDLILMALFIVL